MSNQTWENSLVMLAVAAQLVKEEYPVDLDCPNCLGTGAKNHTDEDHIPTGTACSGCSLSHK